MISQVKVGIVGLGRLGKEYAANLKFKIRQANLVAACSIIDEELVYARDQLGIKHVFKDYEEMLTMAELEVVFVISDTNMHVRHMVKALEADKHVFCEKPLAITMEECQKAQQAVDRHPHLKAVVGFVRRFDPSYRYAKDQILEGKIGEPYLVKSQTVDMDNLIKFQLKFAADSGGIFHDYNVHDIDLARWYLESELKSVYTVGGAYKYPAFAEIGDADNTLTTCLFANATMATIIAGRTATHGHDTYTEIVGTEGTLLIGRPSPRNMVEIYDEYGARKECIQTFWERFEISQRFETQNSLLKPQDLELKLRPRYGNLPDESLRTFARVISWSGLS